MANAPISAPSTPSVAPTTGTSGNATVGFLKKSYMNLPPATRGLVTLVGVGVGLFVVYKIFKSVSNSLSGVETPESSAGKEDRGWASEVDKYNQNPATKATISKPQAQSFAASLFAAMDGYGTDEDAIISVFNNLKNDADYAMIFNAYGVREISSGAWNPSPNFKGTLSGALTDELDAEYKTKINNLMATKKIKYRV
jgi:hypothetical protein